MGTTRTMRSTRTSVIGSRACRRLCLSRRAIRRTREPRGERSAQHCRSTAFIDFLQNHDQIGNRAFGERSPRSRRRTIACGLARALALPACADVLHGRGIRRAATVSLFLRLHRAILRRRSLNGPPPEFAQFSASLMTKLRANESRSRTRPTTFERSRLQWEEREQDAASRLARVRPRAAAGSGRAIRSDIIRIDQARLRAAYGSLTYQCRMATRKVETLRCVELSHRSEAPSRQSRLRSNLEYRALPQTSSSLPGSVRCIGRRFGSSPRRWEPASSAGNLTSQPFRRIHLAALVRTSTSIDERQPRRLAARDVSRATESRIHVQRCDAHRAVSRPARDQSSLYLADSEGAAGQHARLRRRRSHACSIRSSARRRISIGSSQRCTSTRWD